MILLKTNRVFKELKESIDIIIEIKNGSSGSDINDLRQFISTSDYIKPNSLNFINKEKGAKLLEKEFGEEFMLLGLPNPLYDIISFNVVTEFMEEEALANIVENLKGFTIVNDVYYESSILSYVADNFQRIGYGTLVMGIVMIIVVSVLIHNTVKLALHANRFILKNMQLVGASWSFITNPYLRKSVWLAVISSFFAIILLSSFVYWLRMNLPEIDFLSPIADVILLIVVIFALSIAINFLSTYLAVKRYLKMRVDDLY